MKTRISDSEDTSNEESDTEAMGISSPPLPFLAFSSLLIVIYTFVFGVFPSLPCMSPYHAITEALEVPKVVDVSTVPTLIGPGKFTLQFLSSFLRPFFFFSFTRTHHFHSSILLCLRLMCCLSLSHFSFFLGSLPTERTHGVIFETRSSSAIVADPMEEETYFFSHFEQVEKNDLDLVDFWGTRPPYVDFHGYRVP